MDILMIVFFYLLYCARLSSGYFITVDADAQECFFEKVPEKTNMGLMFEIAEGGFLDIDVTITGPDGENIYNGERESSGKFTFRAEKAGVYTYCFSNKMSTLTPKVVMFNLEVEESEKSEGKDANNQSKLEEMIKTLSTTLGGVKREQEYMQVRDRTHREINESTNSRVVIWSFFEALVLVTMTVGQVYYLKRFFEVRRVV